MLKPFNKHSSLLMYTISQELKDSPGYYYQTKDEYGWCIYWCKWSDKNK